MKVAIVSPHPVHPTDSGDRLRTVQLAGALQKRGIQVEVVCYFWGSPPFGEEVPLTYVPGRPSGAGYAAWRIQLAAARRTNPYAMFAFPAARREMATALHRISPDVVDFQHSWTFFETKLPSVVTFHNVESHRLSADKAARPAVRTRVAEFERKAAETASAVVTFSGQDSKRVKDLAPGAAASITEVPLGYLPKAAPRDEQRDTMATAAYVGSFDYRPNLEAGRFLLDQWPALRQSTGLERLLLIGRRASSYFEDGSGVEVASDVSDVAAKLSEADVVVVPLAAGGGVRVKIIEAFALGIPVVSTALGIEGLGAEDGVHAIIVQDAFGIGEGLKRLAPRAERERISANALRLWGERFSPERMAAGMIEVYESVAWSRGRQGT